ncbi:UDP-N-acetylmuramate--L-alanine ligase [Taklimakanibacter albus]|uniref:UDP-N-acetylmuramate--L-alanine ligase n=1 Tax=Taklimakanibacter albus TaxID=2800327 RepID=A0ACC5QYL1_9HYPH|nr:UDP-N-acetylmuramate--L-alanine ligase [Aestuariivirga sp. YIM B02566]MBK1865458.1 UDP-N-acetylmuramate--L-alanine ligase [Aestuariivirga sp. YIM B02566]
MKLPRDVGPIHFIGIGGIGMSGIAEVMATLGYKVQGSDLTDNYNTARLRKNGIAVSIGHDAANLGEAQVVVVSSAVKPENPELVEARRRFLPIVRRAEMLAELMRFKSCVAVGGTHGKTTTTSLVAALLDSGGLDPTVINGGIINAYGTNARLGKGDWMVVESDESDGTFVKLPADVVIVTNIDPEHLDHYGSFDKAKEAFLAFVENIPFYGFAVMCIDHPEVQALIGRVRDRRIITYGRSPQADIRLVDTHYSNGEMKFSVRITDRRNSAVHDIMNLSLSMPGDHNALNATSALAVARELGISDDQIRAGFKSFAGVKRRFTRTGEHDGVAVFDDYGHHPVEIAAVLRAARGVTQGKVVAVMQPHRYTRLSSLFQEFCSCFNDADTVVVAPVYSAGEAPIEGASHDALADGLRARGHRSVHKIDAPEQLPDLVKSLVRPGDIVVCLGAGTITQWAYALPGQLAVLDGKAGAA